MGIEIDLPLPEERPTSRDVQFKITSTEIRFAFRNDKNGPMLEGTLYKRVQSDECTWQLWPVGPQPTHAKVTLVKAVSGYGKATRGRRRKGKARVNASNLV